MKKITLLLLTLLLISCKGEKSTNTEEIIDVRNEVPTCDNENVKTEVIEILKNNLDYMTLEAAENSEGSLTNIFTIEKNDELKSCGCEGTFTSKTYFGIVGATNEGVRKSINISYKAQLNENNEIVVSVQLKE